MKNSGESIRYLLVSNELGVILSNVAEAEQKELFERNFDYKSSNGEKVLKKKLENGWIYLCIEGKDITKNIFDKCFSCYESVFKQMIMYRSEIQNKFSDQIKRFKHNIESYGAKIQDELGEYVNTYHSDIKTYIESVEKIINVDTTKTAKTLLRISKQVNAINNEIEVYKFMNNDRYSMNFSKHRIRKLIDLSKASFFLDFVEKGITFTISDTEAEVCVDYATFSVVLGHIFDNCVKYCIPNSSITIDFEEGELLEVNFRMRSFYLEPQERTYLFEDGYSGLWATNLNLNGNGIGMYYAKLLVEKNKGIIQFIPGESIGYVLGNVPYAENVIKISLVKIV